MIADPLLPSALSYHRLGVSVIPSKFRLKKGAVAWKQYQRQRPDEATLRQWFGDVDNRQLGVAAICGEVSGGLLVRDFDKPGAYAAWKRSEPRLGRTLPAAQTDRGHHVWFRCEGYKPVGAKTYIHTFDDGELRGDGHIVVAPPSLRQKSGKPYRWLVELSDSIPFADLGAFGVPLKGKCYSGLSVYQFGEGLPPAVRQAILATLPDGPGQRNRKVFEFARHLKSDPQISAASPDDLIPYLEQWWQAALSVIRTKEFEVTEKAFRLAWPKVKTPAGGEGSIKRALARAIENPPPPEAAQFRRPQMRLLVALCRELQVERKAPTFYLGCRDAAKAIGLGEASYMTAWRYLAKLCHAGVLQKISSGSQKDRLANEYRYVSDATITSEGNEHG